MNITKDCTIECCLLYNSSHCVPLTVVVVNEEYKENANGALYLLFEVKVLKHESNDRYNMHFPIGEIVEARACDLYSGKIIAYPENYEELVKQKAQRKQQMYKTEYPLLTVDFINENIGKEITWHSYGDPRNFPSKGICILKGLVVNDGRLRPIIEHIKGDDLSYGWVENNYITYSDGGRPVRLGSPFDLYNLKWDVPSMGFIRANGNPMTYGIVVRNDEDVNEKARKATTATEFEIEHII